MTISEYRDMQVKKLVEAEKEFVKAQVRVEVVDEFLAMVGDISFDDQDAETAEVECEAQVAEPEESATDESY